jgi:enoyl-CoA hydratase/carnithine racemase
VPVAVIPGAGGIEYLSSLIGRAKAFEYILTGNDISAQEAARIGWINSAFPPNQLHQEVWATAERIALFPGNILELAKRRINKATLPSEADIEVDNDFFLELATTDSVTQKLFAEFLELTKNETDAKTELGLGSLLPELYK